jgi:hypothetical protein
MVLNFPQRKKAGTQFCCACYAMTHTTRGVSHGGLAIYMKKYLKAKEELWKLKYFTMQKYNLQTILEKKPIFFKLL